MIKLIESLNERLNNLLFPVLPEPQSEHYYELHTTCEVSRSVRVTRFESVKELMEYVQRHHLMYDPTRKYEMVQINSSGEKHILQLNKVPYADPKTVACL